MTSAHAHITCRTFDDVQLYPGPHLNVIVGPNGESPLITGVHWHQLYYVCEQLFDKWLGNGHQQICPAIPICRLVPMCVHCLYFSLQVLENQALFVPFVSV